MPDRGEIPMRRVLGGRVPDLKRIPQADWRAALIPFSPRDRYIAANDFYLAPADRAHALELAAELPEAPSASVRRPLGGRTISFDAATGRPRGHRQLYLRIRDPDYEDLATAARILGVKPTDAARMFISAGVRRLLAEHDIAMADARRPGTLDA